MPRSKMFDIDEAVGKAMELFWKQGYSATSVADLSAHLGLGKGSLYNSFSGKHDIFLKSFKRYVQTIGMEALEPLKEVGDPIKRLRKVFDVISGQVSRDPWKRGCLMVNTLTEMSGKDEMIEEAALAARENLRMMFETALSQAYKRDGERAVRGSWILLNLFLGLRVLARSGPTPEQVQPAIDAAFAGL